MALLTDDDLDRALADDLPDWARAGDAITREARAPSFLTGIGWVQQVAEAAEVADHHPDIDIRYTRVRFTLSTHSEGGVTRRDLDLAGRIDAVLAS